MLFKSRLYATAAFLTFAILAPLDSAKAQTTVYPPTNAAAGSGLLYFPAGGNSSLFAVPVLSDPTLITAINNETAAINAQTVQQTAALNAINATLAKLAATAPSGTTSNAPTTSSISISYVPYPSSIQCTGVSMSFSGLSNGTYVYTGSPTGAGGHAAAPPSPETTVYDATNGELLNDGAGGCPSTI
jgi:hypothetical protein